MMKKMAVAMKSAGLPYEGGARARQAARSCGRRELLGLCKRVRREARDSGPVMIWDLLAWVPIISIEVEKILKAISIRGPILRRDAFTHGRSPDYWLRDKKISRLWPIIMQFPMLLLRVVAFASPYAYAHAAYVSILAFCSSLCVI